MSPQSSSRGSRADICVIRGSTFLTSSPWICKMFLRITHNYSIIHDHVTVSQLVLSVRTAEAQLPPTRLLVRCAMITSAFRSRSRLARSCIEFNPSLDVLLISPYWVGRPNNRPSASDLAPASNYLASRDCGPQQNGSEKFGTTKRIRTPV